MGGDQGNPELGRRNVTSKGAIQVNPKSKARTKADRFDRLSLSTLC